MVVAAATRRTAAARWRSTASAAISASRFAAGITAALTYWLGWRGAFMVPAVVCVLVGIAYLLIMPDDRHHTAGRSSAPDVRLSKLGGGVGRSGCSS